MYVANAGIIAVQRSLMTPFSVAAEVVKPVWSEDVVAHGTPFASRLAPSYLVAHSVGDCPSSFSKQVSWIC